MATSVQRKQQESSYANITAIERLASYPKAVCRIHRLHQGHGSGILIGKNLILTNHHVLPDELTCVHSVAQFLFREGSTKYIETHFNPYPEKGGFFFTSRSPGEKAVTSAEELDFTIVALQDSPKLTKINNMAIYLFHGIKPVKGMEIQVFQHPSQIDPQAGSKTSFQVTSSKNYKLTGYNPFVLHYAPENIPGVATKPKTDAGSSGGAVVDANGYLQALHRSRCYEEKHENCSTGIPISAIADHLRRHHLKEVLDTYYQAATEQKSSLPLVSCPQAPRDFTGREKELIELHEACQQQQRVALSGLGGVGKTAFVTKYAKEYGSYYQWIHFIVAATPETMISGLVALADALVVPKLEKVEERLKLLKQKLDQLGDNYLLIFDGIDDPKSFEELESYLPVKGQCLLLTSRLLEQAKKLNFASIELHPLSLEEAVEYLLTVTQSTETEQARFLAQELGRLPLALTHAASYIRTKKSSITRYRALFKEYNVQLFEEKNLILQKGEKTVLKTWAITMETIEKELQCPLAKKLLEFLSFCASSAIPLELLQIWFTQNFSDKSSLELENALSHLVNYSMLDQGSEIDTYQVHQVMQMVTRYRLETAIKEQYLQEALAVFKEVSEKYDFKLQHHLFIEYILPHVESIIQYFYDFKVNLENEEFFHCLHYIFAIQHHFRRDKKAYDYAQRSLEIIKKKHSSFPRLAHSLNSVGIALQALGRHEEGLHHAQQALSVIHKELFAGKCLYIAAYLNNVGIALQSLGRYEEALYNFLQALVIYKALFIGKHSDLAVSLNNVGGVLQFLGRYKEALSCFRQALDMRKELFADKHPDIAESLSSVGSALQALGQYEEALGYFQQALNMGKELFADKHPSLANSLNNIGLSLQALGRYEEALDNFQQALDLNKELFASKHFYVANSLNNVGLTLQDLGRYEEGLHHVQQALAIQKELFADKHPDIANSLNNIGLALQALGRYEEALSYSQQALDMRKELFASKHPDIAKSLNNVGLALQALGRYEEALDFFQQASAIYKELFASKHPYVANSLNNIGIALQALDRHEEALNYSWQALAIYKALFAGKHLYVANSLNNVGIALQALGRHEEALNYSRQALSIVRKIFCDESHWFIQIVMKNIKLLEKLQSKSLIMPRVLKMLKYKPFIFYKNVPSYF